MGLDTALLLLFVGIVAGFLAGLFGVGGGIVLVPILLVYFRETDVSSLVATHLTFGTSLLTVLFASLFSAYQYSRNEHVVWRAVVFMGVASVAGAFLGAGIASGLQGKALQKIFACVVAVTAVRLLTESQGSKGRATINVSPAALSVLGLFVGMISSLAGVGGGVLSIPMMYYLLHFPLKKALGTSSATIVVTALASCTGYIVSGLGNRFLPPHTLGYVDYLTALPIILGTLPSATVGALVSHRTNVDLLRRIFAVFLLVVSLKMFFF